MAKENNTILGIILVGALILGMMYFHIIPNSLFAVEQFTTYQGSCASLNPSPTNGAVANECYYSTDNNVSIIMKVISMVTITVDGNSTCQLNVIQASNADTCLGNVVYTQNGLRENLTICTFTYSGWSNCSINNQSTRTVLSYSPNGCFGGTPVVTKSCTEQILCSKNSDCTIPNQCFGSGTCNNGNCYYPLASMPPAKPCENATWLNYPTCKYDDSTCSDQSFLDKYQWWIVGGIVLLIVGYLFIKK